MKMVFKISIFINLVLLAGVIFLLAERRIRTSPVAPPTMSEVMPQSVDAPSSPVKTRPEAKQAPFHWSQLEAADYKIYISNLRGIGCPEQTIRDIITADVDGIYAPRREQLTQKQVAQAGGSLAASLAKHTLQAGLQELHYEETAMIEALLGTEPSSNQAATDTQTRARPARIRVKETPIAMPLVLQNIDLTGLRLNVEGLKVLDDLRTSFMEQIGGANQDPNDPAYRERWQKAQANVNNRLEAMIGKSAYQTYQFKVQSAALSQAAK